MKGQNWKRSRRVNELLVEEELRDVIEKTIADEQKEEKRLQCLKNIITKSVAKEMGL